MAHRVAFIGLGVMGHRMLRNMHAHEAFDLHSGWDPSAQACNVANETFPNLTIGDSAEAIVTDDKVDIVYIACPPLWHRDYVSMAIAAGKPVFCEKPLGVDIADSRAMVDEIEAAGLLNAVNFPFARGLAADFVKAELAADALGAIKSVDLRLHFSQWPRDWQIDAAGWLSGREQGGFVREVVSHFIFLTERLFGSAKLTSSNVGYPDGPGGTASETHLLATLACADTPLTIAGTVGGQGPDLVEYTIWGSRRSYRLFDWNRLMSSDGGPWREALTHVEDPREDGYRRMLDNFTSQMSGQPHTMASFREALCVQELIEAMLEG